MWVTGVMVMVKYRHTWVCACASANDRPEQGKEKYGKS